MGSHRKQKVAPIPTKSASTSRGAGKMPSHPKNVGRVTRWKNIHGEQRSFLIRGEIKRLQYGTTNKLICLQQLFCNENGREEFRLGYYMIGVKPRMAGKWTWGQFATIISRARFSRDHPGQPGAADGSRQRSRTHRVRKRNQMRKVALTSHIGRWRVSSAMEWNRSP